MKRDDSDSTAATYGTERTEQTQQTQKSGGSGTQFVGANGNVGDGASMIHLGNIESTVNEAKGIQQEIVELEKKLRNYQKFAARDINDDNDSQSELSFYFSLMIYIYLFFNLSVMVLFWLFVLLSFVCKLQSSQFLSLADC